MVRRAKPAEPVSLEDFQFALQIGNAAGTGQMPTPNPETRRIFFEDSGEEIAFSDTRFNRAILAIADQFRHRSLDYRVSLQWRLCLIDEVADDATFAEWVKRDQAKQSVGLADHLVEALATFPTNLGRALNRRKLLAAVRRIESRDAKQQPPA